MNGKTAMMALLICAAALLVTFEHGRAAPETADPSTAIGIVNVRAVLSGSKKYSQRRVQLLAEQSRARAQLEDLAREVQVEEAGLKALRAGTEDYMQQLKLVLEKRSGLEMQQELLKQQRTQEEKKWLEDAYQDTLKAVAEIAREKGLALVLERADLEFPLASEELMALSTHKVLYSGGCVDLTDDVIARVDAGGNPQP